ncbi:hypothetical protein ACJDUH_14750 [Clostridium sp. WILCCON 0202]|uniref:DNA-binding protein n=2 Tax=Candidatus Clostridium radicumherbarum TaxID=3381662 RepID=A0ABW8TV38_9CLOT
MSVIFGSIWIGYSLEKTVSLQASTSTPTPTSILTDSKALTLSQVAAYLNMTEEEVRAIIQTEKKKLDETHSFDGKMFPYFTINNKQYFYKDEIDEWLKEVSSNHRQYDTTKGWILQ